MAEGRVRGFSVATKCATVDEVIEKFRDRVDEKSILVNTVESRDVGTECAFAILLADKRVALAGTCVVQDVYPDSNNKFQRPGMRLEIKRLGFESQRVWSELVAKRIPPRRLTTSIPIVVPPATPPSPGSRTKTQALPAVATARTTTKPLHGARADSPTGGAISGEVTPPRRMSTVQIPAREAHDTAKNEPLGRAPRATPFNPSVAEGSHDAAPALEIGPEPTEPTLVPGESQPAPPNEFARGSATTVEANKVRVPPSDPQVGAKLAPVLARASSPVLEPKPVASDARIEPKPNLALGTDDQLPVVPRTGTKLGASAAAAATAKPTAQPPPAGVDAKQAVQTPPAGVVAKSGVMKPDSFLAKPAAPTVLGTPALERKPAAPGTSAPIPTKAEPAAGTPVVARTATQPLGAKAQSPARAKSEPRAATSLGTPALARKPAAAATSEPAVARTATKPLGATSEPRAKSEPANEARTPGSAYVLPANPFMNLTDASLEGFVDCRLFEAQSGDESRMTAPLVDPDAPDVVPAMPPIDADVLESGPFADAAPAQPHLRLVPPPAPEPEPPVVAKAAAEREQIAARAVRDREVSEPAIVAAPLEPMRSEPMPLPPPPVARPTASSIAVPYADSGLPNLNVGDANDHVRAPIVSRRTRKRLVLVCTLVPLLGAAAVVGFMRLTAPMPTAAPLSPAEITATSEPVQTMAPVEAAPAAPVQPAQPELPPVPTRPQPIHAVLVRSAPIAAKVVVGGKSFGTTPTYVKIPANTPVELHIERAGWASVTYPLVSKTATDRVFVRLQRARGGK